MPPRQKASSQPVARVLPLLGLPHLDRGFDYLVSEDLADDCVPGVRVRVRFHGRLVDAVVLERRGEADYAGTLRYAERVISPELVFPAQTRALVESLATRYGGVRSDIIRTAIPARHAKAEEADFSTPWEELGTVEEPDLSEWLNYVHGESFVDAVLGGQVARAAWHMAPGEPWPHTVAALAAKTAMQGGGVVIVLPDQRLVSMLEQALREVVGAKQVVVLTAGLGPQARYRRYLAVAKGQARIVIGTRSAAFAPVHKLRLAAVLFDHDDNLVDPRAPYVHAREVLTTRAAQEKSSLIIGGYTRTAETQLLVESGWLHSLQAPREVVRRQSPLIRATADSDFEQERDPHARYARIPTQAYLSIKRALTAGSPVLIQVPRKGYVPTLACGTCRAPARCRKCNGPLGLPAGEGQAALPTCGWCGRPEPKFVCGECGSSRLRAVVLGSERTAEELGRAFAPAPVVTSGGTKVVETVANKAAIVVSTPGAEPRVEDDAGYGAAVMLDTWALMSRADLRAMEDTLAKWAKVVALVRSADDGGEVTVVADAAAPVVQSLIRWDMPGAAAAELAARREVGFPPAVNMAAVDGPEKSIDAFMEQVELPDGAEILGPVDLPAGEKLPGEYDVQAFGRPQRILVRTPLGPRGQLGAALRAAAALRTASRDELPLRIQVDPKHVG
ncbi:primosomal protein N' [Corynebacterium incognita]|uniref:Probable replication restart protein PriA n=1 Tax=Corynebacterium incognita TaxID=2754725 RepID=A0A7G7CPV2_9CORY|nr:primosomal protein N' [Corynebacterium incognita]QNE89618.1 primosomal protein N' [Corynebacterium incognita]